MWLMEAGPQGNHWAWIQEAHVYQEVGDHHTLPNLDRMTLYCMHGRPPHFCTFLLKAVPIFSCFMDFPTWILPTPKVLCKTTCFLLYHPAKVGDIHMHIYCPCVNLETCYMHYVALGQSANEYCNFVTVKSWSKYLHL